MRKILLLFAILFANPFLYCQETNTLNDTIALKEVFIEKVSTKKEISLIINKIRYNLKEKYHIGKINYSTNYLFLKDDKDTLINRKTLNILNIKYLNIENIRYLLNEDPANSFHKDTSSFSRFEPQGDDLYHWLAFSAYYAGLKVADFHFFNFLSNYEYKISKKNDIITVRFTGAKYYSGYFTFNNKTYNLIRVAFKNTNPFDWDNWGRFKDFSYEFYSKYKVNKVTILLDFVETDKGKSLLKKLDVMEELTNFRFKRFNESKIQIDQGNGIKFYTTLNMKILE